MWSGSITATSDYLVRGISRSDNRPALQGNWDVATTGGFIGSVFASSAQLDSHDRRNVELGALAGYAWELRDAWRAKAYASYYVYPWNASGSQYNYAEIVAEAGYEDWLDLDVMYSPNAPRYIEYAGVTRVTAEAAEINARTPWRRHIAGIAGFGYSQYAGSGGGGFTYWSAGGIVDLAPWSIFLTYVGAGAGAHSLFDGAAANGRWTFSVALRF